MNKSYTVIWNTDLSKFTTMGEFSKGNVKIFKQGAKPLIISLSIFSILNPAISFSAEGIDGGSATGSNSTAISRCADGNQAVSSGAGSLAILCNSEAKGVDSIAIGRASVSQEPGAIALGANATAWAYSIAIGVGANADQYTQTPIGGIAIGNNASVKNAANNGIALGNNASSFDVGAIAIGSGSNANPTNSVALGSSTTVDSSSARSIAQGNGSTIIYSQNSIAIGNTAKINGSSVGNSPSSIAVGDAASVGPNARNAIAQGSYAVVNASSAIALGNTASVDANSNQSIAQGNGSTITYAQNSLAIGNGAKISGASGSLATSSIALGNGATITAGATNALAQGTSAVANASGAVAQGNLARASASNSSALGTSSSAASANAMALGRIASVDANSAQGVALGNGSAITYAQNALAIGNGAKVNGSSSSLSTASIALGNGALVAAGAPNAIAQGTNAAANAASTIALGNTTIASGVKSIAMGDNSQAQTTESVAIGSAAIAKGGKSVSIGAGNTANGDGAVSIGDPSTATGDGAVALGKDNISNGVGAIAIGNTNISQGQGSLAFGYQSKSDVAGSMAFGDSAHAIASKSVALGSGSTANNANDVALGAGSITAAALGTPGTTIAGVAYNFAGISPSSVVSFGNSGSERQVTNVAAGRISAASTDAINGSQLYATNSALTSVNTTANKGWNLQSNSDTPTNVAPDGTLQLNDGQNIKVTRSGSAVTIATADELVANSLTSGNTVINNSGVSVSNGAGGLVSLSGSGLDNGGNKLTNIAAGTVSSASNDAVNGSQLYTVQQQASQPLTFAGNTGSSTRQLGSTLTISGGASTAGTYTSSNLKTVVDASTGTMTLQMADAPRFGNVTINDGGKITGLTAGTSDADAVNVGQLNAVYATANKGWNISASGQSTSTVLPGASVDLQNSDGNLLISKTSNSNNVSFALAKSIVLDSVRAGDTIVSNSGISIGNNVNLGAEGLLITNGPSIAVNGINAGGMKITNVEAGSDDNDAVNVSQLKSAISGSKTRYYGANDGGTSGANYNGDGATGTYAVASGVSTSASGSGSVAVGSLSNASGTGATAIGYRASASSEGSVALGKDTSDNGRGIESYVGKYSSTTNNTAGTVSVGNIANGTIRTISNVADAKEATDAVNLRQLDGAVTTAKNYTDDQISLVNKQGAENTTQITNLSNGKDGFFQVNNSDSKSKPSVVGTNAAAGGAGSKASGANSLAIGTNADAMAENSVAVGSDSIASRSNTMSVGSSGKERQITNVSAGTQGTDAVNVNQLKSSERGAVRYSNNSDGSTNYNQVTLGNGQGPTKLSNVAPGVAGTDAANVNQLKQGLAFSKNYTDQAVNSARRDAFGGVAAAIATANLPQSYLPGGSMTSVGLGTYQGQSAVAVGVSTVSDNGRWVFKLSGTSSTRGDTGMGAGVGLQW